MHVMRNKVLVQILLAMVFSLSTTAHSVAVERLDARSFQAACRAYERYGKEPASGAEKALCTAFIQGYLAAAKNFYTTGEDDKDYQDRAVATRAKGLIYKDRRLRGKRYCIPEDESVDALVARINQVDVETATPVFAENVVEAVLRAHYRCPR